MDMNTIIMDLCNEQCFSSQPAILCGKKFNVGHYTQTFQPNFYIPVILMGAIDFYIDFYNVTPFSQTLTLPGGHKVSTK